MSIWNTGKKAARFTFVTMPLSILGIAQLTLGYRHIGSLWRSLRNPVCPECDRGVLVMQEDSERTTLDQQGNGDRQEMQAWTCNRCGFALLEHKDIDRVRAAARRRRNARVRAAYDGLAWVERERYARGHRLHARTLFVASGLVALGFVYLLATGASLLLALNWLSIAFVLWVFAMKKSYRAWQVATGQLFQEGAFRFWLTHEKWLV